MENIKIVEDIRMSYLAFSKLWNSSMDPKVLTVLEETIEALRVREFFERSVGIGN